MKLYNINEYKKEVNKSIEILKEVGATEKEINRLKGYFKRALKVHKAKIKLNLQDY